MLATATAQAVHKLPSRVAWQLLRACIEALGHLNPSPWSRIMRTNRQVGQVRGHTLQDKRAIWKVVQPTGITDALVAVFKKRRQVCGCAVFA